VSSVHTDDFKGRTAVVTGAASGIGLALSRALLNGGVNVLMADSNSIALACAVESLSVHAAQVQHAAVDVTDAEAVQLLVDFAEARLSRVDFLFNNAGISGVPSVVDASLDDWRRIVDVNLWGVINGIHAVLPLMRRQGGGHIVNIASIAGLLPSPSNVLYTTTKFAVVGLSESLRHDLAADGIAVSVACPGAVATNIWGAKEIPRDAISAEQAADEILRGVARKQGIIVFPGRMRRGWLMQRWFPRKMDRILAKMARPRAQVR
jgi:NAD(P)-dependent dehydrogenase (short-subunit alcohol dehydrogenase family)